MKYLTILLTFVLMGFLLISAKPRPQFTSVPARVISIDGFCEYVKGRETFWGLDYDGKKLINDSLAKALNADRETTCKSELYGSDVIFLTINRRFTNKEQLNFKLVDNYTQYRGDNYEGEIVADVVVSSDGNYVKHMIEPPVDAYRQMVILGEALPIYAMKFENATINEIPVSDTIRLIFRVNMSEEFFMDKK